jgi:hypothetical protein
MSLQSRTGVLVAQLVPAGRDRAATGRRGPGVAGTAARRAAVPSPPLELVLILAWRPPCSWWHSWSKHLADGGVQVIEA